MYKQWMGCRNQKNGITFWLTAIQWMVLKVDSQLTELFLFELFYSNYSDEG